MDALCVAGKDTFVEMKIAIIALIGISCLVVCDDLELHSNPVILI